MRLSADEVQILARVFERYTMYAESQLRNSMSDIRRLENFKREMLQELLDETLLLQRLYPEFSGGLSLAEAVYKRTRMKPDVMTPESLVNKGPVVQQGPTEEQLRGLLREVSDNSNG